MQQQTGPWYNSGTAADYPQQVSDCTSWVLPSPISWCHSEVQPPLVGRCCSSTEGGHSWFVYADQDSQKHTQIQDLTHNVHQDFLFKRKKKINPALGHMLSALTLEMIPVYLIAEFKSTKSPNEKP